MLFPDLSQIT